VTDIFLQELPALGPWGGKEELKTARNILHREELIYTARMLFSKNPRPSRFLRISVLKVSGKDWIPLELSCRPDWLESGLENPARKRETRLKEASRRL